MSIDHCKKCDAIVDTDEDGDCYAGNPEHLDRVIGQYESQFICVCWKCRNEDDETTDYGVRE